LITETTVLVCFSLRINIVRNLKRE
jgi:hypothetical protein